MTIKLPNAAWRAVFAWTAIILVVTTPVSVLATAAIMSAFSGGLNLAGLMAAIGSPILIGGPASFYMVMKHQQLKLANQQLQVLASIDGLTAILNRRAFTNLVGAYLAGGAPLQAVPEGAFLVIDADDFKRINDVFGHDRGDQALQVMAAAIKGSIRDKDLVGRIGGEEFGVLLVGADFDAARKAAEGIRQAISGIVFAPDGAAHKLSVSVGGATFDRSVEFSDLYRLADERLYEAKHSGRDRIAVASMLDPAAARAA